MIQPDTTPPFWKAPWEFLIKSLVGVFIFAVISLAAVALQLLVEDLRKKGIDWFIIGGLKGAEYLLFGTDLVLFARFLWKTASRTWKDL